ncbi:hypothetical protein CI109_103633 [Kwoniella shandongensis]|uniref:NAD(+) diphosphatase n=1 Tax=Kwoniella shandongensis TaxID=1734106 RepID=A0A5M6C7Y5_9TREE|nr:uncharacterized protein CI109_000675 [Kwoniella shandongensis]KAA5531103.1 hypothetical protein CI109_000675 [Kwoniella shandongensis]
MGDNIVNFFAGQPPLNRLSFQRHSSETLNKHRSDPKAQFVLYRDFKPLIKKGEEARLLFLSLEDVRDKLGPEYSTAPEGTTDKLQLKLYESARLPYTSSALVFLGIDDRSDPTTNASSATDHLNPTGIPYFALDAVGSEWDFIIEQRGGEWGDARASATALKAWEAGIYAQGRALVDWNVRNKFCPACGSRTYSLWGGWKRNCTSALEPPKEGKEPCFSTKGLHNFAYPRTDPVIIMGILDSTGEKMLLGRQKSWPKGMYSCLAGFIEPGESFEDAVRREVLEEAGIEVGPVRYSSSQPWPYPANLMVGCFGRARDGQTIRLDLDNELEDAQWFSRKLLASLVSSASGSTYTREDYKKLENQNLSDQQTSAALVPSEKKDGEAVETEGEKGITRVPPETAIAGQLVRLWAKGDIDLVSKL